MKKLEKIYCICFSPCGGTRKNVEYLGRKLSEILRLEMTVIDYTLPISRKEKLNIPDNSLVIWGSPVYAGRLPNKTLPIIEETISLSDSLGIPVVSFGNRDFGDALMELALIMKEKGMKVIGGAALVTRHVFTEKLAFGRPDKDDLKEIDGYINEIVHRITSYDDINSIPNIIEKLPGNTPIGPYYVPKGVDGQPAEFLKAHPVVSEELCTGCGSCGDKCPMGTISMVDGFPNFNGVCIKCHACINGCTEKALSITDSGFLSHRMMLEENFTKRNSSTFV